MLCWLVISCVYAVNAIGCNGNINYKPWKTFHAMSQRDQLLKTITAHRGVSGSLCPESSICAASETVRHGIEAMHIDARADFENILWPFADERIGRLTNYVGAAGSHFDMRRSPVTGFNNPKLEYLHTHVIRGLLLRDIDGRVTSYKAITLRELLVHIRDHHPSLALVVQVTTKKELWNLVAMIHDLHMTTRVAVKFFAETIGPEEAKDLFANINNIPVVTGWSLDILSRAALRSHFSGTVRDQIIDYIEEYTYLTFFLYMETPAKEWYVSNRGILASGPFSFVDNHFLFKQFDQHTAIGKRHRAPNAPGGYIDSQGHCCHPLSSWLESSSWIGAEKVDQLETLSKFVKAVNHITSDIPVSALQYLQNAGHRVGVCRLI